MSLIKQLAQDLNKTEGEIKGFLRKSPLRYKVYTIPKRTHGHRVIAQPSRELKIYQKSFLNALKLPIHHSATAYRKGLSIKDNAERHKDNPYVLRLDLNNFFNSITPSIFWEAWKSFYDLPLEREKRWFERLLFWSPSKSLDGKLVLSIGAPTSPELSNFIMYNFDEIVSSLCTPQKIVYTRYADDLFFSTSEKDVLFNLPEFINQCLVTCFGGAIYLNKKKTNFSSKAHNRHFAGITVNNAGQLSLGRARKRYIKHLVHQFHIKKLKGEEVSHLQGLISFSNHIEPRFIKSLETKYSPEVISLIKKGGVYSEEEN